MLRKPLSIVILSIIYFLSPLVILIFNAALNMVPLLGYGSIIYRLRILDVVVLFLYILTAFSIFFVRKWGWWTIISSALLMFSYNLFTFFMNPFSSILILLLMNVTLFSVSIFFFRKHLIAPYFNPQLRWWEQDQRYEIDIYLKFIGMDRNVIISDISAGGCYIYVDFLIDSGSELPVLIICGSYHLNLNVKIMRIARESDRYYGYGLMFQRISNVEKEGLEGLLKKLKSVSSYESDNIDSEEKRNSTRFFVSYDLSISSGEDQSPASLSDISKSGCSIHSSIALESGAVCQFHYRIRQVSHYVSAKVIWKKGDLEKRLYGLKFIEVDKPNRKALQQMINISTKLGAHKREISKEEYYKRCEERLDHTPYELIKTLKRIMKIKTG